MRYFVQHPKLTFIDTYTKIWTWFTLSAYHQAYSMDACEMRNFRIYLNILYKSLVVLKLYF